MKWNSIECTLSFKTDKADTFSRTSKWILFEIEWDVQTVLRAQIYQQLQRNNVCNVYPFEITIFIFIFGFRHNSNTEKIPQCVQINHIIMALKVCLRFSFSVHSSINWTRWSISFEPFYTHRNYDKYAHCSHTLKCFSISQLKIWWAFPFFLAGLNLQRVMITFKHIKMKLIKSLTTFYGFDACVYENVWPIALGARKQRLTPLEKSISDDINPICCHLIIYLQTNLMKINVDCHHLTHYTHGGSHNPAITNKS